MQTCLNIIVQDSHQQATVQSQQLALCHRSRQALADPDQ